MCGDGEIQEDCALFLTCSSGMCCHKTHAECKHAKTTEPKTLCTIINLDRFVVFRVSSDMHEYTAQVNDAS